MFRSFRFAITCIIILSNLFSPVAGALTAGLLDNSQETGEIVAGLKDFNTRVLIPMAAFEELGQPIPLAGVAPGGAQALRLASSLQATLGGLSGPYTTYTELETALEALSVTDGSYTFEINAASVQPAGGKVEVSFTIHAAQTISLPVGYQNDPEEDSAPGADGTCMDVLDNDGDQQIDGDDPDCARITLEGGTVQTTLSFDLPLSFQLDPDPDPDLFYLTGFQPGDLYVIAEGPISAFTGRFGFTDLTVDGTARYNEHIQVSFRDPDDSGGITQDEWTNTSQVDLLLSKYLDSSDDDVHLTFFLDSTLIEGDTDGTIDLTIPDLSLTTNPTVEPALGDSLKQFANIYSDEMLAGLAAYAVALKAALAGSESVLPYLKERLSDTFNPGKEILDLVRRQGDAILVCQAEDAQGEMIGPPDQGGIVTCMAVAPQNPQAVESWKLNGVDAEIVGGAILDTVGLEPTAKAKFTNVQPGQWRDITVKFQDPDGAEAPGKWHTVQPRMRSAQELLADLQKITGMTASLEYKAPQGALEYQLSWQFDPDAVEASLDFGNRLSQDAHLYDLTHDGATTPELDTGQVTIATGFGALLTNDVRDITPGVWEGADEASCSDHEDNDGDGFIDSYDLDCPRMEDRFFIGINDGYEISVQGLSFTLPDGTVMDGHIGFLGVQADVSSFSLTKVDAGSPVLGVNFLPKDLNYNLGTTPVTMTEAIGVRDLIDRPNLNLPGIVGYTESSLNLSMASSLQVEAELSGSTLSGGVEVSWPNVSTGKPLVTMIDPYQTDLLPFDIQPTVVGFAGEGSAGNVLVDGTRTFTQAFGTQLTAGSTLEMTIFNVTDSSGCSRFVVTSDTELTCPDGLQGPVASEWNPGDEYQVLGDPQALEGILLDSYYNLVNRLNAQDVAGGQFARSMPLIGVSPRDLVVEDDELAGELAAIKLGSAAADIHCEVVETDPYTHNLECWAETNLIPDNVNWDINSPSTRVANFDSLSTFAAPGEEPTERATFSVSMQDPSELENFRVSLAFTAGAPAASYTVYYPPLPITTLQDFELAVEARLGLAQDQLVFSLTDLVHPSGGSAFKHLVARLQMDDSGPRDFRLRLDLPDDGSGIPTELTAAEDSLLTMNYSTQLQLDIGVPLNTIVSPKSTVVLDTTAVQVEASVSQTDFSLSASLGGAELLLGASTELTGTVSAKYYGTHTSTISSTLVMTDTAADFLALNLVPGGAIIKNVTDNGQCPVASIAQNTVTCSEPLSNDSRWDENDQYELTAGSPTRLTEADSTFDFSLYGLPVGTRVYHYTGDTPNKDGPYCEMSSVSGNLLVCASPGLPGGEAWHDGDHYLIQGVTLAELDLQADLGNPGTGAPDETFTIDDYISGLSLEWSGPDAGDPVHVTMPAALQSASSPTYLGVLDYKVTDLTTTPWTVSASVPQKLKDAVNVAPLDWSMITYALPQLGSVLAQNLDGAYWNERLPLVGEDLQAGADLQDVLADLNANLSGLGAAVADDDPSEIQGTIQDAISAALPAGTALNGSVTVNVECDNDDCSTATKEQVREARVEFTLTRNLTDPSLDPGGGCTNCGSETENEVIFDIGLPGLPITSEDPVQTQTGWSLNINFGLSRADGPFLVVDGQDELALGSRATILDITTTTPQGSCSEAMGTLPDPIDDDDHQYNPNRCIDAVLGLLPAVLFDGDDAEAGQDDSPSYSNLYTTFDLKNDGSGTGRLSLGKLLDGTKGHAVTTEADTAANFYFKTTFGEDIGLPAVVGTIHIAYGVSSQSLPRTESSYQITRLAYQDLYLITTDIVSQFLANMLEDVRTFTRPFQPVIDVVKAPIPVISDLSEAVGAGTVSLYTILDAIPSNKLQLIIRIIDMIEFINNLPAEPDYFYMGLGPGDDWLAMEAGSFNIKPSEVMQVDCGYRPDLSDPQAAQNCYPGLPKDKLEPVKYAQGRVKKIFGEGAANSMSEFGLSLPLLDDSREIYGMFVGADAVIAHLDLGTLSASAGMSYTFGPFFVGPVPVTLSIGGDVSIEGRFAMGYDTRGLRLFLAGEGYSGLALLDGIFLDDYDANGVDVPEITLSASIYGGAAVSIYVFEAGLQAGATFKVMLDLNDPDQNGRMYIDEISVWRYNPVCLFVYKGTLEFFLRMYFEIDLFLFSKRFEWEPYRTSPPINLFEVKCEPPEPKLGQPVGNYFRLNMGSQDYRNARNIFQDVEREKFIVRQITPQGLGCAAGPAVDPCDSPSGTWVTITFQGIHQDFFLDNAHAMIKAWADTLDDVISLLPGTNLVTDADEPFTLPSEIHGGSGNDRITTGLGNDTVYGDEGNDVINAMAGDDTLIGGPDSTAAEDNDSLDGGLGNDILLGGAATDTLNGGPGHDVIRGGPGSDTLNGGPGLPPIVSLYPEERLHELSDLLVGEGDGDSLEGVFGGDYLFGDSLTGYSDGAPSNTALRNDLADDGVLSLIDPAAACASEGTSTGIDQINASDGNDFLFGGPLEDRLAGGNGDDYLCGHSGEDFLDGEEGLDELHGGPDHDVLYGHAGNDDLYGDAGNDELLGGDGRDLLVGGSQADILLGDEGTIAEHDPITDASTQMFEIAAWVTPSNAPSESTSGASDHTVDCGLSRFTRGEGMDDCLKGESGVDFLFGEHANDALYGGSENDYMQGNDGDDFMQGGADDDWMWGGQHNDTMYGDIMDDALTTGDDTMFGDSGDDWMYGGPGTDTMHGNSGEDRMQGNAGQDWMWGDAGQDDLTGGSSLVGALDDVDHLYGSAGHDVLVGDNGLIQRDDPQQIDNADGSVIRKITLYDLDDGNNLASDLSGGDFIYGEDGNDEIYGGGDKDELYGNAGDDYFEGNGAGDMIFGQAGQDDLVGGTSQKSSSVSLESEGISQERDGISKVFLAIVASGSDGGGISQWISASQDGGDIPDGSDKLCGGERSTALVFDPDQPCSNLPPEGDFDLLVGDNADINRNLNAWITHSYAADAANVVLRTVLLYDMPKLGDQVDTSNFGDDSLWGGSGYDLLYGQNGNDHLYGGPGVDLLQGNGGNDYLYGQQGQDDLVGGTGQINGEPFLIDGYLDGDDHLYGDMDDTDGQTDGDGADVIMGDNAVITRPLYPPDSTVGTPGYWVINTFNQAYTREVWLRDVAATDSPVDADVHGDDHLWGSSNDDRLWGQGGDDEMYGGAGDDYMEGNADSDLMLGGPDQDDMAGGTGRINNDPPVGTDGRLDAGDVLSGGEGFDFMAGDNAIIVRTLDSDGQWVPNSYNGGLQHEIIWLLDVDSLDAEQVSGPDKMDGNDQDDVMYGQGNGPAVVTLSEEADTCDLVDNDSDGLIDEDRSGDCMSGGAGDDYMEGNGGGDTLFGNPGQDDMLGGTGRINFDPPTGTEGRGDGPDEMYGEYGAGEGAADGSGADVMLGDNGVITRPLDESGEWIENSFNQTTHRTVKLLDIETVDHAVPASAYDGDLMWGNDNDDWMWGQGGEDEMYGGAGDDYMEGNNHSDLMHGDADQDDMLGGTGPTISGDASTAVAGRFDMSTQTRQVPLENMIQWVPLGDTMYGDGGADVMLGDNGLIRRPIEGGQWVRLDYFLASDSEGDTSPRHILSETPSWRYNRTIQNLDQDLNTTAGSDLMYGGPGDDDLYGQFDDTNGPALAIGDEIFGEGGEDAILGDNGQVDSWVVETPTSFIAPNEPFIDDHIFLQGSLFRTVTLEQIPAGGDDRLSGGDQGDWMHGGAGNDLMNGNDGADRMFGDDNDDVMWGGYHHDHLWGGYGNDYLDIRPRPEMTIGDKKPVYYPADPLEWFAYAEQDNYQGVDYIYGGWDQDAMQANVADEGPTIGDRLLDWVGAYNAYYLCPGLYGEFVVTRDLSPAIMSFLQQLSEGDGAVTPATPETSGFDELGLVYTKDIRYNQRPVHMDNPGHFTCEP